MTCDHSNIQILLGFNSIPSQLFVKHHALCEKKESKTRFNVNSTVSIVFNIGKELLFGHLNT